MVTEVTFNCCSLFARKSMMMMWRRERERKKQEHRVRKNTTITLPLSHPLECYLL
jgi:hypothetical protein